MKADDLKSAIRIKTHNDGLRTVITGKLEVVAQLQYHNDELNNMWDKARAIHEIKELIREKILAHIYDDQRRELCEAVEDLLMASPRDYTAMSAARARLLKAARYQLGRSEVSL